MESEIEIEAIEWDIELIKKGTFRDLSQIQTFIFEITERVKSFSPDRKERLMKELNEGILASETLAGSSTLPG